jgi:hypothetical protein
MLHMDAAVFGGARNGARPDRHELPIHEHLRRRKSIRSIVKPKHSPWRMPEPSGQDHQGAVPVGRSIGQREHNSVASGSIRDFVVFGSFLPSHGLCAITPSRMAARKMPETIP